MKLSPQERIIVNILNESFLLYNDRNPVTVAKKIWRKAKKYTNAKQRRKK